MKDFLFLAGIGVALYQLFKSRAQAQRTAMLDDSTMITRATDVIPANMIDPTVTGFTPATGQHRIENADPYPTDPAPEGYTYVLQANGKWGVIATRRLQ